MSAVVFRSGDWTVREVVSMHAEGRTQQQIADALKTSRKRVRILYARLGLKTQQGQKTASWVIVAPAGHVVSRHASERTATQALYVLRKTGCRVEPAARS